MTSVDTLFVGFGLVSSKAFYSFLMKYQGGDIKCYSGAPNFSIHPHIGEKNITLAHITCQ